MYKAINSNLAYSTSVSKSYGIPLITVIISIKFDWNITASAYFCFQAMDVLCARGRASYVGQVQNFCRIYRTRFSQIPLNDSNVSFLYPERI